MSQTIERRTALRAAAASHTATLADSYDPPVRGPVLLATDGTGATDATFFAAQAVADRLGTGVDVIGVLEPLPSYLAAAPLPDQHLEHWRIAALDTAIRRRLDGLHHVSELWPVSIHLGETARTIARVASLRTSSVVVVGLGSHSFRDRVLGG